MPTVESVETMDLSGLIRELSESISYPELAKEVGRSETELQEYARGQRVYPLEDSWRLIRTAYKHNLFEVLPAHGVPPVSYDIRAPFDIRSKPVGFDEDPPLVPLVKRPAKIAGYPVDFPLGLPASVLASNSQWIKFYARRGFDILTYKTVRTVYRESHPFPNWVFVKNPEEVAKNFQAWQYTDRKGFSGARAIGCKGFWPATLANLSMANSFGVPSLLPDWWMEDIREARKAVREGHQVLIVSVVGSKAGLPDDPVAVRRQTIAEDFIAAALKAKAAGADIIEANFSCPNVSGDPVGDLYHDAADSAYVSHALKSAIAPTPLFVKIGYLPAIGLREFVELNTAIDGIVAINTISASVVDDNGQQTFPDGTINSAKVSREKAGISGWAIKERAKEVTQNLVAIRNDLCRQGRKPFTILSVGGIVTPEECWERLSVLGESDGVESCTGALLNPYLGLQIRFDAERKRASALVFGANVIGKFVEDVLLNPTRPPGLRIDTRTRQVVVERK
jgi:dihydroorotate dehydrogenase (NAD+) catalytic subunit